MLLRQSSLFALLAVALAACGYSSLDLPGFDAAAWRRDAYACEGARTRQLPILEQHREQLYGLRNGVVNEVLGHPDEEELSTQTERVFYYYVQPGPQCAPSHPRSNARRLAVRFGPLGTVTEVIVTAAPNM